MSEHIESNGVEDAGSAEPVRERYGPGGEGQPQEAAPREVAPREAVTREWLLAQFAAGLGAASIARRAGLSETALARWASKPENRSAITSLIELAELCAAMALARARLGAIEQLARLAIGDFDGADKGNETRRRACGDCIRLSIRGSQPLRMRSTPRGGNDVGGGDWRDLGDDDGNAGGFGPQSESGLDPGGPDRGPDAAINAWPPEIRLPTAAEIDATRADWRRMAEEYKRETCEMHEAAGLPPPDFERCGGSKSSHRARDAPSGTAQRMSTAWKCGAGRSACGDVGEGSALPCGAQPELNPKWRAWRRGRGR